MISKELKRQTDYEIVADAFFETNIVDCLDKKRILITGSTGLIGTQICKSIIAYNIKYNKHINLVLCARSYDKLVKKYNDDLSLPFVDFVVNDIRKQISYDKDVDYVIHCAGVTSSRFFVSNPVETIDILLNGTKAALEFAKSKNVSKFLYLSSLEVYGDISNEMCKIKEDMYGTIDFLNTRSSYSEGKRMCECLCSSFNNEYDLPVYIARLSQTIGCDIEKDDKRVFAEFARCSLNGENIVLKSSGNTIRSYCDVVDAITALFYILKNGERGNAYNIANKNTLCSINEFANLFCSLSENKIKVTYDFSKDANAFGYNNEIKINLDTSKIESLGWHPIFSLRESIIKLLEGLEDDN